MHAPAARRSPQRLALLSLLVLALLTASLAAAWAAAAPSPDDPLLVINYDLQGAKGPLPAARFGELRSLLMYLQPDIIALHTVLKEASGRGGPLAQAALAMDMYYAYEPLTDTFGSALLSRGPMQNAVALYDEGTQALMGLQVEVRTKARTLTVLVVRPPNDTVLRKTPATVAKQLKGLAKKDHLLLASFSPRTRPADMVKGWKKLGLWDPAALLGLKGRTTYTYPYARPTDRLDFVLLSSSVRADLLRAEVLRNPRLAGLSEHLPVAVTLRK